jgi:hypothetical protein
MKKKGKKKMSEDPALFISAAASPLLKRCGVLPVFIV